MRTLRIWASVAGLLAFVSAHPAFQNAAHADEVYTFVVKKQEQKAKSRWSLQDWLETRDRMRLMDLWLALHSPSPYEFYLGGGYTFTESAPPAGLSRYQSWEAQFAAYASIFGLELKREVFPTQDVTRWNGLFHLRVFGYHAQGTNITLHAGLRQVSGPGGKYRNALAGASMSIYLAKFAGIEGLYRHAFAPTPVVADTTFASSRYEGGAFIDFKFLRVYGTYFSEPDTATTGVLAGTKLFF
jgi:hypothetical protein